MKLIESLWKHPSTGGFTPVEVEIILLLDARGELYYNDVLTYLTETCGFSEAIAQKALDRRVLPKSFFLYVGEYFNFYSLTKNGEDAARCLKEGGW